MLNILSAGGLWSIMLLLRRCCVTIRDLSIKENDVMATGFKGKQIGQVLQSWLEYDFVTRVAKGEFYLQRV